MKLTNTILTALALAAACATAAAAAAAAADTNTVVYVGAGHSIEVRPAPVVMTGNLTVSSKPSPKSHFVPADEIADVVKALEILLKHAPSKYDESLFTTAHTFGTSLSFTNYRATKADQLRNEAMSKESQARTARERADEMDKEQADIEWARNILAKWKAKVRS